jgi:hypothetical protein
VTNTAGFPLPNSPWRALQRVGGAEHLAARGHHVLCVCVCWLVGLPGTTGGSSLSLLALSRTCVVLTLPSQTMATTGAEVMYSISLGKKGLSFRPE